MRRCKLGDIADICLGKMLDKEKNKGDYQPYLANINVRWGDFDLQNLSLMRFEKTEQERYGLKYGDIVMCEGGEPGRCAIWRDEMPNMKIQKALHRIRVHSGIDSRYIYYWFLFAGRNHLLEGSFIETTIKHLTGDRLKLIELELPSYAKQKRIGDVLEKLDNKIALNNRLNATLEAMAKNLYDYWFVQFDFPDEKGRPYKTSGGKMVYNEELGREIPAGWEVKLIGDLLEKVSVPKGLQTSEYQSEGILPIIDQSQQFIVGYTNCTAMECLPNEAEVIVFGDHTCFFKYINFPFALGADGTQCIISNEPLRMPQLLFYYAIKDISLANKGYARHFKFLKGTSILVPAAKTAQSFQHTTEKLYGVIRKNIRETYHLAALRDWLLPMLMNGQVGFKGKCDIYEFI